MTITDDSKANGGYQWHSPYAHVSSVFLAIDNAQESGSLVVLEVESHIVHSSYYKREKTQIKIKEPF